MSSTALEEFIREALKSGETPETIAAELIEAGWPKREVDDALAQWAVSSSGLAMPRPRPYISAREAFLYIVMFNLLGLVAYNLGSLLFALINMAVEDVLDLNSPDYLHSQIRFALAALVVATPLLSISGFYIASQRHANPAMQKSRVRTWLTYVTLVAAALTFVGDLIALVSNFLSGDLSERLLMKLAVVALIAAGIFIFFLRDVEAQTPRGWLDVAPLLAGIGFATVVVTSFVGYLSIEDPVAIRELRLDEAKLVSMKRIAHEAQCAFNFTGRVPRNYVDIRSAFESDRTYSYEDCVSVDHTASDEAQISLKADAPSYIVLCATFLRPSGTSPSVPRGYVLFRPASSFPELDERRSKNGMHCFRVKMLKFKQQSETTPAVPPVPPAVAPVPDADNQGKPADSKP